MSVPKKISIHLQIAVAAETRPAEGQWVEEQLNMVKLFIFQPGTRRATLSSTEGKHLASL
jgi:hypothetical protein